LNVGNDPTGPRVTRLLDKPAPAFELSNLAGGTVSSDALAGKTVVVNFWNEWCVPCIQELPQLKEFWAAHAQDPDVAMIGIAIESRLTPAKLEKYAQRVGIDWTIALDPGKQAALHFAVTGQPETFVISPSGMVAGYQYGPASLRGLEAMLAAAEGA
jgi:peroxiredoxin